MGLQPFDRNTMGILICSLITGAVVLAIPVLGNNWFINVGVRSVAITLSFTLACWGFNLSPDIRQLIENKLKR